MALTGKQVNWILDADIEIESFFDLAGSTTIVRSRGGRDACFGDRSISVDRQFYGEKFGLEWAILVATPN